MAHYSTGNRISKVEITNDTLSGRGGLALFSRYLSEVGIYELLLPKFHRLRKSEKGLPIWSLFHQVFCFFLDGGSRHLTRFDESKKDAGYAGAIEHDAAKLASSHAIKRFFKAFPVLCQGPFRAVLKRLFIWRLQLEQPDEIELTIDSMVMDNDEANKRHGVQPTYKKVKGFQPLQAIWNGRIVDAIFRGGKKNGNHGTGALNMIVGLVTMIRAQYRADVTIIIRLDAGFFDQAIFSALDKLGVVFIASGKMYDTVKTQAQAAPEEMWGHYSNGRQGWSYLEFGFRCDNWDRFYRAFYTRPVYEGEQGLLEFARPDNVIITNLGTNPRALEYCSPERRRYWVRATAIIGSHHMRGADELPHRGLKDFGFEQLPFKRFAANSALYYCMLIAFFLFECFKRDVLVGIIPITSYANTVRRRLVDVAAKIVRTGNYIILKLTAPVMERLQFQLLWQRCQAPPPIPV